MEFATWYDRLAQDGGDAVDALVDAAEDEEERLFVATHAWYFRRHPNPAQHLFERAWAEGPESRVGRAAAEWLRTRTRTTPWLRHVGGPPQRDRRCVLVIEGPMGTRGSRAALRKACSTTEGVLATISADGAVLAWDGRSGRLLRELGSGGWDSILAPCADGRILWGPRDGPVYLEHPQTAVGRQRLPELGPVCAGAHLRDDLVAVSLGFTVRIVDASSGRIGGELQGDGEIPIRWLAATPGGLVVGGGQLWDDSDEFSLQLASPPRLFAWEASSGRRIASWEARGGTSTEARAFALRDDGTVLAWLAEDTSAVQKLRVVTWDPVKRRKRKCKPNDLERVLALDPTAGLKAAHVLSFEPALRFPGVCGMSLTPDERLVSTDSGGTVSVWDPRRDRGTQARSVSPWDRWIAVGPKGPIVSNGWDDLYVFDFDGTCRHALPKERGGYVTMCPVRNGRVAVASREWGLRVLDAWRGAWEFGLDASPDSVTGMAALTDGRLVTTGRDKMLRVWNLDSGACEEVIEAQIALHDLAVVADRYAVSSGPQHSEIFDLEARHSVYRLPTVYCNYVPLGDGLVALKHSGKDCTDIVHLPSGEIRTRLAGEWPQMATPESGLLTWRPRRGLTWFGVDGESRGRIADVLGSPLAVSPESLVATKEENRICVRRLGSDALVAAWDTRPLDARLLLFLGRRLFVARETGPLLVLDVELDT